MSTETKTPLLPGEPELLSAVFDHYPTNADATHTPWTVALVNTITAGFWKESLGILTYVDMCRLEVTCAAGAVSKVVNLRPTGIASWHLGWILVGAANDWECVLGDNPNNFIYYPADSEAAAFTFESLPPDIDSVSSVKLVVSVASGEPSGNNALTFMIADDTQADSAEVSGIEVSNVAEYNQWVLYDPNVLGVNRVQAVSDADNSTGVFVLDAADLGKIQVYRFGKMVAASPTISAVQLKVYGIVTDAVAGWRAVANAFWVVDGVTAQSESGLGFTETVSNGTFTLYNPLGGDWTSTEVDKIRAGIRATDLKTAQMNVLDMELIITYTSGGTAPSHVMNGMTRSQLT